jgi:hypothetical protein
MATEKFSGAVKSAWGHELPEEVKFSGTFEAFETYEQLVAAKEEPSHDEVVAMVNNKRKAAARSKATLEALEQKYQETGDVLYQKPDPNSEEFQTEQQIKLLMKRRPELSYEKAKARVLAMNQAA